MEYKEEVEKLKREKTAGFFLDLAKLSFAGMVIGSLVSISGETAGMEITLSESAVGTILTIAFAYIGFNILKAR